MRRPHSSGNDTMVSTLPRARHALAFGIALALVGGATAATAPQRFTPVLGEGAALYPQSPASSDTPPRAIDATQRDIDNLVVELDANHLPADGQTATTVRVRLLGADGQPLRGERFATIEHSGGRVLLAGATTDEGGPGRRDADRATPGVQLEVVDGVAEFQLLAPHAPQDVLLRVTAGKATAQGVVSYVPEMREMLATGFVDAVVRFRDGANVVQPARSDDGFEREIRRWERDFNGGKANAALRTAFFLKGRVKGEYLLTAAFDSDKDTRARLLRDIRPDEYYPVYGDSSLLGFDARSADRLYLRVDKGRSYLLYGDFQTTDGQPAMAPLGAGQGPLAQRSLGLYNRSATGLNWHVDTPRVRGNVFAMHDDLRQVIEEFPSQGSGPYGLRNNAVYEGSERVEVVVRDRNQPSRILSVRPLLRFVDYSFEVFSGRILLNQFLPAFDSDLNPVSLRVTYEVDQGTEAFWVAGADAQVKLGERVELGGSLVDDRNPFAESDLGSLNAGVQLDENTRLVAEVARSRGEVNTNPINQFASPALQGVSGRIEGDAWRVELDHDGERFDARLFAGASDPQFNNPASPLYGGRGEASLDLGYALTERVDLYLEALRSVDRNVDGGEREGANLGARWQATERLTLDLGLRKLRETVGRFSPWSTATPFGDRFGLGGSVATGSAGGALGFGQQPLDPQTGLPLIWNGVGQAPLSDLPIGTQLDSTTLRLGAGWQASQRLMVGGEVEADVAGEDRERVALGVDYQWRERQRLYARAERQTGLSGLYGVSTAGRRADTFVFGVDSTVLRDTQLFNEYRLRDAIAGRDVQAANGIRNLWEIREGLRLTTAFEHVNVIDGLTGDATGAAFGLDWTASELWRAATRVELRRTDDSPRTPGDEAFDTGLWQLSVGRKIDRDWTLLARNYFLRTDYAARGDVLQNRTQVGLAYRDTDTNRVNALARYEYKLEDDDSGLGVATGIGLPPVLGGAPRDSVRSRAHIVSTHADWHPSRPWWLTGRLAAKWQDDRFTSSDGRVVDDDFNAWLASGRVVYDVTENWDLGLLGATFRGEDGANQYAYGVEVGRLLRQNLWLSVGYNWAGFEGDPDLARYEYTQDGVYLRLRFKFDETLFMADPYASDRD
jgi:hypothetical protein